MKYKVTTRGWIVFSLLGILILYGLIQVGGLIFDDTSDQDDMTQNELISDNGSDEDEDIESNNETSDESVQDDDDESNANEESSSEDTDNNEAVDEVDDSENTDSTSSTDNKTSEDKFEEVDLDKKTEIIFNKNDFALNKEYLTDLNDWLDFLMTYKELSIVVEGHINGYPYYNDGSYGLNISEKRALVIKEYLVGNGIDEERIEIINMGSKDQVVKTSDVSEHYKNRRAVIYIKERP